MLRQWRMVCSFCSFVFSPLIYFSGLLNFSYLTLVNALFRLYFHPNHDAYTLTNKARDNEWSLTDNGFDCARRGTSGGVGAIWEECKNGDAKWRVEG